MLGPAEMPAFLFLAARTLARDENLASCRNVIIDLMPRAAAEHIQHILNINMAMHE
jgi:hypothetical protein